eukprot:g1925.t1
MEQWCLLSRSGVFSLADTQLGVRLPSMNVLLDQALSASVAFAVGCGSIYYLSARNLAGTGGDQKAAEELPPGTTLTPPTRHLSLNQPLAITEIRVRSQVYVDRVTFVFNNGATATWGGSGGTPRPDFTLSPNEYVVEVRCKQGAALDSIQFFTNLGRLSPLYGGEGGSAVRFLADPTPDGDPAPIAGLIFPPEQGQGWCLPVQGVISASDMLAWWCLPVQGVISASDMLACLPTPPAPPDTDSKEGKGGPTAVGFLREHHRRVRSNLSLLYATLLAYGIFMGWNFFPLLLGAVLGPVDLQGAQPVSSPYCLFRVSEGAVPRAAMRSSYSAAWLGLGSSSLVQWTQFLLGPAGAAASLSSSAASLSSSAASLSSPSPQTRPAFLGESLLVVEPADSAGTAPFVTGLLLDSRSAYADVTARSLLPGEGVQYYLDARWTQGKLLLIALVYVLCMSILFQRCLRHAITYSPFEQLQDPIFVLGRRWCCRYC